jgi:starch phosphorylase
MGYQVQPLQEFLVRPQLPESLPRITEIAYNVLWSWDHAVRAMFRRLDSRLWNEVEHNPILLLSRISPAQVAKAASDPRYISAYRRACERFDSYMERYHLQAKHGLIAYFCMEFGVVQCMPIYSGGLGVLAGDHLKAASDLGLPLVGVGLLYQKGYFRQSLNPDGWQQERTPVNDFYTLPVQPAQSPDGHDVLVSIDLPGGALFLKVWLLNAGGVKLVLLDSNTPENQNPDFRNVTDQLYAGDKNSPHRLKQEIALGIGGVRALRALGIEPTVFHMNEGHSAFLAIERIRLLMSEHGLNFAEALEAARQNNIFTTHTSVPAGFDEFQPPLLYEYFHDYCERAGIPFDSLLGLGRRTAGNHSDPFSMAVSAL